MHSSGVHGSGHAKPSTTKVSGTTSEAKVHVNGYTKKDGTQVTSHNRTSANATASDNWSTKGNVNPETGKTGTKPPEGKKRH
ncbi:MAG TPA: hypothetical protein VGJ82_18840 [Thermoanaerobaculia bacterium]